MNRFVIAMVGLTLMSACGGTEAPDPCVASPTYTNDIVTLAQASCTDCHRSELQGSARSGAPEGLNFDDYETLEPNIAAFADAFTSGRMPPMNASGAVLTTAAERNIVDDWRRCGFPK